MMSRTDRRRDKVGATGPAEDAGHRKNREETGLVDAAAEDRLIAQWLEPDPHKGGKAEYRVVGRGVQLWALAGYLRDEHGHPTAAYLEEAAHAFELPPEAVRAAFTFYRRHQAIVDDRVAANEA